MLFVVKLRRLQDRAAAQEGPAELVALLCLAIGVGSPPGLTIEIAGFVHSHTGLRKLDFDAYSIRDEASGLSDQGGLGLGGHQQNQDTHTHAIGSGRIFLYPWRLMVY